MKLNIKKSLSLALASMSLLLPSVSAVPPETSAPASTFISCVDFRELSCFKSDKDVFISAGNIARKIYEGCVIEEYAWYRNKTGAVITLPYRKMYMTKEQIDELDNLLVKIKESEDCHENADLYIIFCLISLYKSNGKDTYAEDVVANMWASILRRCTGIEIGGTKGIDLFNKIFSEEIYQYVNFETVVDKDGKNLLVSRKWQWIGIGSEKIEDTAKYTDLEIMIDVKTDDEKKNADQEGLRCTIWRKTETLKS